MASLHPDKRTGLYHLINRGKWIALKTDDYKKAKRIRDAFNSGANLREMIDKLEARPRVKITFLELLDEYIATLPTDSLKEQKEKKVQENGLKLFKKFLNLQIHDITSEVIQGALDKKKWNGGTQRRYLHALKKLFAYAVQIKLLADNPVKDLKLKPLTKIKPRFIDDKTLSKLFALMSPETKKTYEILLFTGLRPSELLNLIYK